jgi:hypothetical protein
MDSNIRKKVFTPLASGSLSALVSDFCIHFRGKKITVPALLTSDGKTFRFRVHFMSATPPAGLGEFTTQLQTVADRLTVSGQIDGEIAFQCRDVFRPAGGTTRSRGTSTISFNSSQMEFKAEGSDKLDNRQLASLLKAEPPPGALPSEGHSFTAHIIFVGPKLRIRDSGSAIKRTNDFLGEAASSSADTHVFAGHGYEGALIQTDDELHLHLRSTSAGSVPAAKIAPLVDRTCRSIGFAFGFHPWPAYREIRVDHRLKERWLSPRLGLKQTFFAPISEALWAHYHGQKANPLFRIIPLIEAGLGKLKPSERKRIETLLWHVRSADLSELPDSTKMLILCAAFDGLMQLISGFSNKAKTPATNKVWRKASRALNLSWDGWTNGIFAIRNKYRNDLSHGRLWVRDEKDLTSDVFDYAKLGCAFMTVIAAWCGYDGPVLADPFQPRQAIIRDLIAK